MKAFEGFGQSVLVAAADGFDRGLKPHQPLAVFGRDVLKAAIRVMKNLPRSAGYRRDLAPTPAHSAEQPNEQFDCRHPSAKMGS